MRILVTGHKGFIGQNLTKALIEQGHFVDGYEWPDRLPYLYEYDWVIHLGAISTTTETNVEKIMDQNFDFSVKLINLCKEFGVNFQYASSASVYGLKEEFKEDSPVNPLSPYAWSKYLFDRYVQQNYWGNIVQGFRYFNVYGPHEEHKGNQASPYHKFTEQAKTTGNIKLFEGSDTFLRDFVPVEHVVDIHKKFLNIKESGIWNVGTGIARSFKDIATEIADKHKATITYIPMPANLKLQYQAYTKADITKLKATLNEASNS
jgi:ADP-L-glycero-D-manno-heptose 6-epimerase